MDASVLSLDLLSRLQEMKPNDNEKKSFAKVLIAMDHDDVSCLVLVDAHRRNAREHHRRDRAMVVAIVENPTTGTQSISTSPEKSSGKTHCVVVVGSHATDSIRSFAL